MDRTSWPGRGVRKFAELASQGLASQLLHLETPPSGPALENLDFLLDSLLGGSEKASVDGKGRMLLSVDKRRALGEVFYMSFDPRGCVVAFSRHTLALRLKEFQALPQLSHARSVMGHIIAKDLERDINCDAQGRVVLPSALRKKAKIDGKAVVVGSVDQVEIWSPEMLDEYHTRLGEIADDEVGLMEWARNGGKLPPRNKAVEEAE